MDRKYLPAWLQSFIENLWWIVSAGVILIIALLIARHIFIGQQRHTQRDIDANQETIAANNQAEIFPWLQSMDRFFLGVSTRFRALFSRTERDPAGTEIARIEERSFERPVQLRQLPTTSPEEYEERRKESEARHRKLVERTERLREENFKREKDMRCHAWLDGTCVEYDEAGPSNRLVDSDEETLKAAESVSPLDTDESGSQESVIERPMAAPQSSAGPSNPLVAPESVSPQESVEFDSGSENQRLMGDAEAGPSNPPESDEGSQEGFVSKNRDDKQ
ncbi:hypothetical protein GCK72_012856 [Caenorhabditis remanei]|uniref:Uncharacterized protein n=1 Tax=Caenorhabditis remanei TaxID=31234 RepID=A0A6A5GP94_CAERE|nr:hypothetical protein GCK72_012856 [Caenorhabditis remanei]KAF1756403.1 hypothetical protein GCK72_012856 [Caenorhabditis remanei]